MSDIQCFNCCFFEYQSSAFNTGGKNPPHEYIEGECHRHRPALGVMLTDHDGDEFRHFGEWPKVLACDWCGQFKARERAQHQHAQSI